MRLSKMVLCYTVTVTLLAGCGVVPNGFRPEKITADPPPSFGTIVFSSDADSPCFQTATFLAVAVAGAPYRYGIMTGVDGGAMASDFSDHLGALNVLQLHEGEYELYPFMAAPLFSPTQVPVARFNVKAGEAVYLGNFYMPVACHVDRVVTMRDKADRDLALVRQRNPRFAKTAFEKRISSFDGYLLGGPPDPKLVIKPGPSSPEQQMAIPTPTDSAEGANAAGPATAAQP